MKSKNLLIALVFLITVSCKKSNTTTSPSTGSVTAYNYKGEFGISKFQTVTTGTLSAPQIMTQAGFYFYPFPRNINSRYVTSVNSVGLNGIVFHYNGSGYEDTTNTVFVSPNAWVVNGANGFPSFTYTDTIPSPMFTGYALWPDTVYKNQNNTLSMKGVTGTDRCSITIYGGSRYIKKTFTKTDTSVFFLAAELSALGTTNNGSLSVSLIKEHTQVVKEAELNLGKMYVLDKPIVIK